MTRDDQAAWKKVEQRIRDALWFAAGDNSYEWSATRPLGFVRLAGYSKALDESAAQDIPLQAVIDLPDNPLVQAVQDLAADLDRQADEKKAAQ